MPTTSPHRRKIAFAGLVLLAAGATAVLASPAYAVPEVQLSASAPAVNPGDTLTVTETVTNVNGFTILQPRARLFSTPNTLTSYASLVSCTGATSCTTVNGPNGPIGFQGALPAALGSQQSATVTFTLKILTSAPDLVETLQGQLFGSNYASDVVNGPTLTVTASADAAVSLNAAPKLGLLVSKLEFTLGVSNNGPGAVRNAKITTALPPGLSASATGPCVAGPGNVVCTVNHLAKGASTTAKFSVPLNLLSLGVPYTFTATRTSSDSPDPNAANDSDTTTCTVITPLLVTCS